MAKFNPTITVYLVPYIIEGYDNEKFFPLDDSSKSRTYWLYHGHQRFA